MGWCVCGWGGGGRSRWSEGGDCLEKEAGKERRGIEGFVRKKSERRREGGGTEVGMGR